MNINSEVLKTGGQWLGAASGAGVPAYTFFSSFPPPLFPKTSIITAALSTAILFIALKWRPKTDDRKHGTPHIVKRGSRFIGLAVLLLIVYVLLLKFTTIDAPSGKRLQIGFGQANWSLTEAGRDWVRTQPAITVVQMVTNEAAFDQNRLAILWPTWSINLAGLLLILLYFLSFTCWTAGFALLVKQRSLAEKHMS